MGTETTWSPSPPAGYEVSSAVPHHSPSHVRAGLLFGVVGAVAGALAIAWIRRSDLIFESPAIAVGVIPLIIVEVGVHEMIHMFVGRWAGWQTLFRIERDGLNSAPAVLSYGAFQTRRKTILFYLAPLCTLSVISLAILMTGTGVLPTAALVVLTTTIVSSTADLHNVWFVFQLPEGSLERHNQAGDLQYYIPYENHRKTKNG